MLISADYERMGFTKINKQTYESSINGACKWHIVKLKFNESNGAQELRIAKVHHNQIKTVFWGYMTSPSQLHAVLVMVGFNVTNNYDG
jgi:hypothetical protein